MGTVVAIIYRVEGSSLVHRALVATSRTGPNAIVAAWKAENPGVTWANVDNAWVIDDKLTRIN